MLSLQDLYIVWDLTGAPNQELPSIKNKGLQGGVKVCFNYESFLK